MEPIARGLAGVVAVATRISHVDGERGLLTIGGYPVEAIAPRATFEEALHLLWHGSLPSVAEADELHHRLAARRWLPAGTITLLHAAAARRLPIMDALRMAVDTLQLDAATTLAGDPSARLSSAIDVVARVPTIVATYVRLRAGRPPVAPDARLRHAANYLAMLRGEPATEAVVRALETYLVTVIDHGLSASTFAARVVASTAAALPSAVVAALCALKGPLHGGAPGPVLDMFDGIEKAGNADAWIADALKRGERLMGFGHRVYRVRDPRANVLKTTVAKLKGRANRIAFAEAIEAAALRALRDFKTERRLDTNVEFYTALLLEALNIPREAFTPVFALARTSGWIAHIREQETNGRLIRPQSRYVGTWPVKAA